MTTGALLFGAEAFVVCQNFAPPPQFRPEHLHQFLQEAVPIDATLNDDVRQSVPFVACGDLTGWDADQSYDLEEGYVPLPPVQPPTAPAYAEARARQHAAAHAHTRQSGKVSQS